MPGPSWSLDARLCPTGQKLRAAAPQSPCAKCYACKGRFTHPPVIQANDQRYAAWRRVTDWPRRMAEYIRLSVPIGDPYFRWFSSGDLQDARMLEDIIAVAERTPGVRHWLPTQEHGLVTERQRYPENLIVRLSAPLINGITPNTPYSSVVLPRLYQGLWPARVARNTHTRYSCPAPLQGQQCRTCRACWNPEIRTIVYLEH